MRRFWILLLMPLLILRVHASETKYVALTFDDGPSGRFTEALLEGLYDRGAKATFLLCGYRIAQYPELTQRIFDEGHEIGLHGYSHKTMKTMSRRAIAQEILDTEALLPEGCKARFLRPPGGFLSDPVVDVAQARGLPILKWSVDPRDWATNDAAAIETAVLDRIRDGDIVLLHDMSESSVNAALAIVDQLLEQDFEFVTVSELVRLRQAKLTPGREYTAFPKSSTTVGEGLDPPAA